MLKTFLFSKSHPITWTCDFVSHFVCKFCGLVNPRIPENILKNMDKILIYSVKQFVDYVELDCSNSLFNLVICSLKLFVQNLNFSYKYSWTNVFLSKNAIGMSIKILDNRNRKTKHCAMQERFKKGECWFSMRTEHLCDAVER